MTILLVVGLIFPTLSLLTLVVNAVRYWRYKKHGSAVLIPFIGPILLTGWILLTQKPLWLAPIAWIGDLGTLLFLIAWPRVILDRWRTSRFTRILTLTGSKDVQIAILTFHSTGHYLLKKTWNRLAGQTGIVGLGEPGTFVCTGDVYTLTSHYGGHRILRKISEVGYLVEEPELKNDDLKHYSLDGWVMAVLES